MLYVVSRRARCRVRHCGFRLCWEAKGREASEILRELSPLAVEQDTPEVKQPLGTLSAPTHARTVKAHGDEVTHRTLGGSRPDVEVEAAEDVVTHAGLVFLVVFDRLL